MFPSFPNFMGNGVSFQSQLDAAIVRSGPRSLAYVEPNKYAVKSQILTAHEVRPYCVYVAPVLSVPVFRQSGSGSAANTRSLALANFPASGIASVALQAPCTATNSICLGRLLRVRCLQDTRYSNLKLKELDHRVGAGRCACFSASPSGTISDL